MPIEVWTAEDLYNIRNDTSAHYIQMADIDLSIYPNWEPLGGGQCIADDGTFSGIYDGNNFTISNLTINDISEERLSNGLFSPFSGTAKNIKLVNINVVGGNRTGGLIGKIDAPNNEDILIENCHILSGSIIGKSNVGGIVGNLGTWRKDDVWGEMIIKDCSVTCSIQGSSCIGGIIGKTSLHTRRANTTYILIQRCLTTVNITVVPDPEARWGSPNVGGIAGKFGEWMSNNTTAVVVSLKDCFSYCTVSATISETFQGCGFNIGSIIGYSLGNLSVINACGVPNFSIDYTNDPDGSFAETVGPLIGNMGGTDFSDDFSNKRRIINSYYNIDNYTDHLNVLGIGKTTTELKEIDTFNQWDFSSVWSINSNINNGYPYLRDFVLEEEWSGFINGDGSLENPYEIWTADDLYHVRDDLEGCYIQMADIDLKNFWNWDPIMAETGNPAQGFEGRYNGNNFNIKNLFIINQFRKDVTSYTMLRPHGLFGSLYGGELKNINLINCFIEKSLDVLVNSSISILVGEIDPTPYAIENCHIKDSSIMSIPGNPVGCISGYSHSPAINCSVKNTDIHLIRQVFDKSNFNYCGLLFGWTNYEIERCYAQGNIYITDEEFDNGSVIAGGLCGAVYGIYGEQGSNAYIKESFSNVNIFLNGVTSYGVGGFVGFIAQGLSVENCYAVGFIESSIANNYIGGFLGYSSADSTIENCYAAISISVTNTQIGGFMGEPWGDPDRIINSYYDIDISNQNDNGYGVPKTTEEMKEESTFTDWDFESIWVLSPIINDGYPYLQYFVVEPDLNNLPIAFVSDIKAILSKEIHVFAEGTEWETESKGGANKNYIQVQDIDWSEETILESSKKETIETTNPSAVVVTDVYGTLVSKMVYPDGIEPLIIRFARFGRVTTTQLFLSVYINGVYVYYLGDLQSPITDTWKYSNEYIFVPENEEPFLLEIRGRVWVTNSPRTFNAETLMLSYNSLGNFFNGSYNGQNYKWKNINLVLEEYGSIFPALSGSFKNVAIENAEIETDGIDICRYSFLFVVMRNFDIENINFTNFIFNGNIDNYKIKELGLYSYLISHGGSFKNCNINGIIKAKNEDRGVPNTTIQQASIFASNIYPNGLTTIENCNLNIDYIQNNKNLPLVHSVSGLFFSSLLIVGIAEIQKSDIIINNCTCNSLLEGDTLNPIIQYGRMDENNKLNITISNSDFNTEFVLLGYSWGCGLIEDIDEASFTIHNNTISSIITCHEDYMPSYIGGILPYYFDIYNAEETPLCSITNNNVDLTISLSLDAEIRCAGGLVGSLECQNILIENNNVEINILNDIYHNVSFGGIIGRSYNLQGEISQNAVTGTIPCSQLYSSGYISGFIGRLIKDSWYGPFTETLIIKDNYSRLNILNSIDETTVLSGFIGSPEDWYTSENYSILISNCYYAGVFSGEANAIDPFVGDISLIDNITMILDTSSCYFDKDLLEIKESNFAAGKTTSEMKTQSTFTDWDFIDIWKINIEKNDGYPYFSFGEVVITEINLEFAFPYYFPPFEYDTHEEPPTPPKPGKSIYSSLVPSYKASSKISQPIIVNGHTGVVKAGGLIAQTIIIPGETNPGLIRIKNSKGEYTYSLLAPEISGKDKVLEKEIIASVDGVLYVESKYSKIKYAKGLYGMYSKNPPQ